MPSRILPPDFEVLIADDEAEVRELLVEFFRTRQVSVAQVTDGRAAIAEVERAPSRFGLILTDLHMPGADGLTVLERVRRCNPAAIVVIITGYASLDSAVQAVRLGAYDYLTKPFSLGQLEILLKRVAERHALQTENRQLSRMVDGRETAEAPGSTARVEAFERRLIRLEALVERIAARK
jgi:two-component system response regulator AtoC